MDLLIRILLVLINFLELAYFSVVSLFCEEEKRIVYASDDPLLNLSATVLAKKIRNREITSEEVVKAYIKRIKEVNPIINAVVDDRFEEALDDAKRVDDILAKNRETELEHTKPLLGIPVTIKEAIQLKGCSFTACSKIREGIKAEIDCEVVARLKESGAIPLLVSNTPECCLAYDSTNKITGRTKNPYNTLYTSGGSSGGEGALLGAGASVIGIGSDVLGSIRVPSAFNGIFGHKPSHHLVPTEGHLPSVSEKNYADYLVFGPMTRYAEDLKLALKVIVGKKVSKLNLDKPVDLSKVRIFSMEDCGCNFGLTKVDKKIKAAIGEAVSYLKNRHRCTVSDRKFVELGNSMEMATRLVMSVDEPPGPFSESKGQYNFLVELFKNVFGKSIFSEAVFKFGLINKGIRYGLGKSVKHVEESRTLKHILTDALKDDGVFIYPTYPTAALKRGLYFSTMSGGFYSGIFNILGFPSTSVPVGFNNEGLPIGIQVVAAAYQDRLCLAVAEELEKCFHGWQPAS